MLASLRTDVDSKEPSKNALKEEISMKSFQKSRTSISIESIDSALNSCDLRGYLIEMI